MSDLKSIETLEAEVDPRSTELALAYIDRRLAEEDAKTTSWAASKRRVLPAVWPRDGNGVPFRPSKSVKKHLTKSYEANQEFLLWLRDEVVDGNPAWTQQLAEAEAEFQNAV